MSTLLHDRVTPATTGNAARTAVAAAALAAAVASAGTIAGWFLLADPASAASAKSPATIIECLAVGIAFVVLAVSLPALADLTRLPRWALNLAAGACAFIAIEAWAFGTVVAHLAQQVSATEYTALGRQTVLLLLLRLPVMFGGLAGFVTLAVVGWRRQAMPRGACVVLALGGVACLAGDFPPVGLLAGIALAWTARSARPARPARSAGSGSAD